jgi:RHS repeat-associated protein
MPRTARASRAGYCYHVLNRGNARKTVFHKDGDFAAFVKLLREAQERTPIRLLSYCRRPPRHNLFVDSWPRTRRRLRDSVASELRRHDLRFLSVVRQLPGDGKGNAAGTQLIVFFTDPVGNQTGWAYDQLNRQVQEVDPLGSVSIAAFDVVDRIISATDKNGQVITFSYDPLNRETGETWRNASGTVVDVLTFTFDANNNLLTAANSAATNTMSYDALDRLSTLLDTFNTLQTLTYDAADNRLTLNDSFGGAITRTYDSLNRVTTMQFSGQSQTLREDFAYTVRDQVSRQTRFSNLAGTATVGYSTMSYDSVRRMTNQQHLNASGGNIANFTNTYDLASRITAEILNGGARTTYQYDFTNQLTNDSAVTYTFDSNGNRTMSGYSTGPANSLLSDGTWNYFYDRNGNQVQKVNISTGETFAFGFDNRNRLTTVQDTTTTAGLLMQATYVYDALNQRIEKDVMIGGVTTVTRCSYDQDRQIWADTDGSNSLLLRYVRGQRILELPARVSSGGTVAWLLPDRLGSVRNVLNSSGALVDTISYDGFGNPTESSPGSGGVYMFAGYRFDEETELFRPDMTVTRYYDPKTGRWVTRDPIGFGGGDPNLFRYVVNCPINAADPSGLDLPVKKVPSTTNVYTEGRLKLFLGNVLGYIPKDPDTLGAARQGCIGLTETLLRFDKGKAGKSLLCDSGTRCFFFDQKEKNIPTLGDVIRLRSLMDKELKCPKGQQVRMFIVQFHEWRKSVTQKDRPPADVKENGIKWEGVAEVDGCTVGQTNVGGHAGGARFDYGLLLTFEGRPESSFWIHMNHGLSDLANSKENPAIVELSDLEEFKQQDFQHAVICAHCGPKAKWYFENSPEVFLECIPNVKK